MAADDAPPLADVRVVEQADTLAASYAGHLLRALGAEVTRLEASSTVRRPGDHVVHRGKRSVAPELAGAACVAALGAGADVLLGDGDVAPAHALQIVCRLTPWGAAGPASALPDDEALVAALTGVQALQWSWSRRPVWLVTPVIAYMTGMLAALGVTAALLARRRGAAGQRLEVSALAGAFALNGGTYVTGRDHQGSLSQQGDPRGVYPTYGLYATADGWLFVGALTQAFWVKLMTVLGREHLLAHPLLQTSPLAFGSPEIRALVRHELEPLFAAATNAEWGRRLREADVPCGAVGTRDDFLRDPEARALGFAVPVDDPVLGPTWQPGVPALFSDTPLLPPRPASAPGADTAAACAGVHRPSLAAMSPAVGAPQACLDGVRVLDLTSFIAGPVCPMLLADLGADVVKVETAEGDPFRMAAFGFAGWNRGKRSLVLDLKRDEGREVFLDLARRADVVVDNFRGGVMERLGLGRDVLRAANPRLVHTAITGYGSTGPLAPLPGFDPVFQARSGLAQAQGGADEPVLHLIAYNDYCAGALGALATVAALVARERTGRGQHVDVSLFRTAFVDQAAEMILYRGRPAPAEGGRDHLGPSAARRLYEARDGWLCVAARTAEQAAALGRLAGVAVQVDDPPAGEGAAAIAAAVAAAPRTAVLERLAALGVPAAPCLAFEELFAAPQLRAAGCIVEQGHPVLGPILLAGPCIEFSRTPIVYRRAAPVLGADGPAVLAEIGYPAARVRALVEAGVVGGAVMDSAW